MAIALNNINPISNSDYVIQVTEMKGVYWTEFSGIKASYSRAEYNDGLSQLTRTASGGNKKYETVTISKPYDPDKDSVVDQFISDYEGGEFFNLNLTPVRFAKGNTGGRSEIAATANKGWSLSGCRLLNWSCAEGVDTADGSKTLMYKLEFSVEQATPTGSSRTTSNNI
jgi:hypothetical protein